MTAEQLEELASGVNPDFIPMGDWEETITTLARRVISAEKLVKAAEKAAKNYYSHPSSYIEGMSDMDDAIVAYREASK